MQLRAAILAEGRRTNITLMFSPNGSYLWNISINKDNYIFMEGKYITQQHQDFKVYLFYSINTSDIYIYGQHAVDLEIVQSCITQSFNNAANDFPYPGNPVTLHFFSDSEEHREIRNRFMNPDTSRSENFVNFMENEVGRLTYLTKKRVEFGVNLRKIR